MHFYCEKLLVDSAYAPHWGMVHFTLTCGQKLGLGGLIDCQGDKDVKRTGVKNLGGGSSPPIPPSTRTLLHSHNSQHSFLR